MSVQSKEKPVFLNSISEAHHALGLPKPLHPLVSFIDGAVQLNRQILTAPLILGFYKISYKENLKGKMKYGQSHYDFTEGGMFFTSPNQLISRDKDNEDYAGYSLMIHPDFLRNYPLGKRIKNFGFFSYSANEALHLSELEKEIIISVFKNIKQELLTSIDDFSQDVMIALLEVLLNYSNRFYKRQFITRKVVNTDLLSKMERILSEYFNDETVLIQGLPSVQYLAEQLNMSPGYLSDMLRALTGQNAQQHIHATLIEKAKEILSVSTLSISEIAYRLGFEHPQSFSKLFKNKTNLSPLEFRQSFN